MHRIPVKVERDHLDRLANARKPMIALSEMVWNALDADATRVEVKCEHGPLGVLSSITVTDNGHGITPEDATIAFGNLGGSWKKTKRRSKQKNRFLHGKIGQGRFKAYSLGNSVTWTTRYRNEAKKLMEFTIIGRRAEPGWFDMDEPRPSRAKSTGTAVVISDLQRSASAIAEESSLEELTERFALYLFLYPEIKLLFNGSLVDAMKAVNERTSYNIVLQENTTRSEPSAILEIVEWKNPKERALYLCDSNGLTIERTLAGIQARGFEFTAYLKSDYIRELDESGLLGLEDMNPILSEMVSVARAALREHFREREARKVEHFVKQWKKEKIYPFEGEPGTAIERTERQLFDVVAATVTDYLPAFSSRERTSRHLSFQLLRHVLEDNPSSIQTVLEEVFNLPAEKLDEFAELIDKTGLAAIINATRVITNRMDFLRGLESLVFDPLLKPILKERQQLHRLLEQNTWVFGEEYNLTVSDQSLNEVLRKHLGLLGRESSDDHGVVREDGREGIVDLMLSRSVYQSDPQSLQHLIVELKRPRQKIDRSVAEQIESYANAVANDERFRDVEGAKWVFWAVSNEMDSTIRRRASQKDRRRGILYQDESGRYTVWVKTWGEIIQECKGRLEFYRESLEYTATAQAGLDLLRSDYAKFVPETVVKNSIASEAEVSS